MATAIEINMPDKRASRFSTYSTAPTLTPSIAPSHITDTSLPVSEKSVNASPLAQEMRDYSSAVARLEDPKLQSQRYVASETKRDEIERLALGAKLERALGRRMTGQDACFRDTSAQQQKVGEKA